MLRGYRAMSAAPLRDKGCECENRDGAASQNIRLFEAEVVGALKPVSDFIEVVLVTRGVKNSPGRMAILVRL